MDSKLSAEKMMQHPTIHESEHSHFSGIIENDLFFLWALGKPEFIELRSYLYSCRAPHFMPVFKNIFHKRTPFCPILYHYNTTATSEQ